MPSLRKDCFSEPFNKLIFGTSREWDTILRSSDLRRHSWQWSNQPKLGSGFKYFSFSPLFGEDFQFDDHIFQRGWFNHQLENLRWPQIGGFSFEGCWRPWISRKFFRSFQQISDLLNPGGVGKISSGSVKLGLPQMHIFWLHPNEDLVFWSSFLINHHGFLLVWSKLTFLALWNKVKLTPKKYDLFFHVVSTTTCTPPLFRTRKWRPVSPHGGLELNWPEGV